MRRVLYVGAGDPWAGGAGFLTRQRFFLEALAETADVHMAMFDANARSGPALARGFFALPLPVRKPKSKFSQLTGDMLLRLPRMIREFDARGARKIAGMLKPSTFDAVFAYRIDFAYFAGVLGHPELILDIDDPEHMRASRRLQATTGGPGDWRTARDVEKLRRFERAAVAKAKLAFVCQENDAEGWTVPPQVVPNCVEVIADPVRAAERARLLFVGNCAGNEQSPNVDGVKYFLDEIWPKILEAQPDAVFQIAGTTSEIANNFASKAPNVQLLGFVPDLGATYAQASASIAPIRFGTGTRVKIIEAFAHGCPVVSTVAGAEGIRAVPGREIEMGTSSQQFVDRCLSLMRSRELQDQIGRGGYEVAKRFYDRSAQHERVVLMLKDFLAAHDGGNNRSVARCG